MKNILSLLFLFFSIQSLVAQTVLKGTITSSDGPVIGAACTLIQNEKQIKAIASDFDGHYHFVNINPGIYDLKIHSLGYTRHIIHGISVTKDSTTIANAILEIDSRTLDEVMIKAYKKPLIDFDNTSSGSTIKSSNLRESRSESSNYYVDGIRVTKRKRHRISVIKERPTESENFDKIIENKFISPNDQPLSTLSIDVDRASYSTVRKYLNQGVLPPIDAVRIEEMINYFEYSREIEQKKTDRPFNTQTTLTNCPWNSKNKLLHIKIDGQTIPKEQIPPSNLVFLIDVSGSMNSPDKLPLLVSSFKLLVNQLRDDDRIAIVVYAGAAGCVLESTPGTEKMAILDALEQLRAGGSTAGAAGIEQAYQIASKNFIENGNNRVVLATDGDFNVGISNDEELVKLIEEKRENGVFLSVLGFGSGNYKDGKMQKLANAGNGNHNYIDNMQEAQKVFSKEFTGTLFTIAKDVKIQIEFNPAIVKNYRMVGYENRLLNAEDFNDDTKDAGELGAGHQVTVMYELNMGMTENQENKIDPLKYSERVLKSNDELATIKYRYKNPDARKSIKSEEVIEKDILAWNELSEDIKWAMCVAEFGMLLRNSDFCKESSYAKLLKKTQVLSSISGDSYKNECTSLIEIAMVLDNKAYAKK